MKTLLLFTAIVIGTSTSVFSQENEPKIPVEKASLVDYEGFSKLTKELQPLRETRLVTTDEFKNMALDANTIILDTRSKAAFDEVHIKGAVHLNFSDFTEEKLAKVIPSKDTRILIYCNNNFISDMAALLSKKVELALNIPTFVNLHGYGYENVYELGELVILHPLGVAPDKNVQALEVEGNAVDTE